MLPLSRFTSHIIAPIMLATLLLCGCREKPSSAGKLYRRSASGVVLVANRYYYSMNIGGRILYFTGLDTVGNLLNVTDNTDSVTRKADIAWGTGFFIDSKGNILTNRHIVRPETNTESVRECLQKSITRVKNYFESIASKNATQRDDTDTLLRNFRKYAASTGYHTNKCDEFLLLKFYETNKSSSRYEKILSQINGIRYDNIIINCASNVKVAFHKSNVSQESDFKECEITRVSGMDDTDLAVIRLKSRITPRRKYVFHFAGKKRGKRTMLETLISDLRLDSNARQLRAGSQLCMLSYSEEPDTALSENKIKAQVSTGEILHDPDDNLLRYSLPVLKASGGSPVMNMFGDVVCVNYAKSDGVKTFNFGIPVNKIKKFLGIERD